ncbi:MAG: hypothetical protein M3R44_06625 [Candidatus Eremiobacteraeota bacterium]|nr:hypothetical protein [Candidatus Eremiobacteraeota bacterium]
MFERNLIGRAAIACLLAAVLFGIAAAPKTHAEARSLAVKLQSSWAGPHRDALRSPPSARRPRWPAIEPPSGAASFASSTAKPTAAEWWRLFGHLHTAAGRRFDFSVSFFRFSLRRDAGEARTPNPWMSDAIIPATLIIVDERQRQASTFTQLERNALGLAAFAPQRLPVRIGTWELAETTTSVNWRRRRFSLHAAAPNATLDLLQAPLHAPVRYGTDGSVQTGTCNACRAHEEAYTRLRARGTLALAGARFAVDGLTWLDHESSSHELGNTDTGWDRFAFQLDDGRDIELRLVRARDGRTTSASSGVVVAANNVTVLDAKDFTVENPLATHWHSPRTGIAYPSLWEAFIRRPRLDLAIIPPLQDQEISAHNGPSYYDASVDLERQEPPGGELGHGYVELTGYDRPLRL